MRSNAWVVCIPLALLVAAAPKNAAAFENGRELAEACRVLVRGLSHKRQHIRIPKTKDALLCWGYMQAAQDLVVLTDESGRRLIGACPPEKTTTLDLVETFLAYSRSQSEMLDENAFVAVIAALQNRFPCKLDTTRLQVEPSV